MQREGRLNFYLKIELRKYCSKTLVSWWEKTLTNCLSSYLLDLGCDMSRNSCSSNWRELPLLRANEREQFQRKYLPPKNHNWIAETIFYYSSPFNVTFERVLGIKFWCKSPIQGVKQDGFAVRTCMFVNFMHVPKQSPVPNPWSWLIGRFSN